MYKRILSSILLLVFIGFSFVNVVASKNNITEVYLHNDVNKYGRYYVEKTIVENQLPYDIVQYTDIGYTSAGEGMCTSTAAGFGNTEPFEAGKYYPQQVNVLEVPSSEDVKIIPWSLMTPTKWGLHTVRSMIRDFEEKNPGYRVIAAVNADFCDHLGQLNLPYPPNGANVSNGEFFKTSSLGTTIGFKNDGTSNSFVGVQELTRTAKMILAIYDQNNEIIHEFNINRVNQTPENGEIAIVYANWNTNKEIVPIQVENGYIVSNAEYAIASQYDFYGRGVITNKGSKTLSEGEFAIVSNNPEISSLLSEGVKIRAQYEFTGAFADVTSAVGVGQTILLDSQPQGHDTNRHPRTMIGVREDGSYIFTVVDGRQTNIGMYGATQIEMSAILKHYGAVEAYNLDGGGSSSMMILKDGELVVLNSPSDARERNVSNAILIATKVPTIDYYISDIKDNGFIVNADVVDYNGFDFDDLYVGINNDIKKLEQGKVGFENLNSNTNYSFQFYQQQDGIFHELVVQSRQSTAKKMPKVQYVEMYFDDNDLIFEFEFYDPDLAITRSNFFIAKQSGIIYNNKMIFSNYQGELNNISISLSYDLNNGYGRQDIQIKDFKARCDLSFMMQMIRDTINNNTKIYK